MTEQHNVSPEIEAVVEGTELPRRLKDKVYSELADKDVTVEEANDVVQAVVSRYEKSRVDPLDPVGTVSAQSIGEPGTQMSIPGDERVVIRHNGTTELVEIGTFIDELTATRDTVTVDDHEVTPAPDGIEVLSLRRDEHVAWKPLAEVSRHEAPDELLKFELASGRTIRATKAHSFVTREDNEVVPIAGEDLEAGDRLPIVCSYDGDGKVAVGRREYLPAHGSRGAAALTDGGTTTVSKDDIPTEQGPIGGSPDDSGTHPAQQPTGATEQFPLDEETGFFVGTVLATGRFADDTVSITNANDEIRARMRAVAERFEVSVTEHDTAEDAANGRTFHVDGTLLGDFLQATCIEAGTKVVPEVAFDACGAFVRGLLSGYFSSGSSICDPTIRARSTSKQLIEGISLLLGRVGLYATHDTQGDTTTLRIPEPLLPAFADRIELVGHGEALAQIVGGGAQPSEHTEENGDSNQAVDGDVVWDRIESIETVTPEGAYVYDFSVAGLDTFTTAQGVVTHNTMNTFHYAGVAEIDVTQGLPRLIELVDARKEPDTPMMTVYLEDEYATSREKAHEVVWQIEATQILSLGDVSTNVADMQVRVDLNEQTLLERWPTVDDPIAITEEIASTIESKLGVETRSQGTVIQFGPEQPSYRDLLQLVEELREITFKGIEDIGRVVVRKEDTEQGEEFVLYTEGSAFGEVLSIDGVDATRTSTNDIHEIYQNLGVEAAREAIINETMETLEEQGLDDVNIRHLMLVADIMTNEGTIESIGRHGISGSKDSVLARAAFEVTVSHLLSSAIHGEIDDLNGVTENVIVGKPIKLGTGDVNLRMGSFAADESAD